MTTRTLAGPDLNRALIDAQAAFIASAATSDTWRLPAGRFVMASPLALGASGRSLTVEGSDTELVFGTVSGPAVIGTALLLIGVEVRAADLRLSIQGSGDCIGLEIAAEARAGLADVAVVLATGGNGVGIAIAGDGVELRRCAVRALVAGGDATGIRAAARDGAFLDTITVAGLDGAELSALDISGAQIRCSGLLVRNLRGTARVTGVRLQATVNIIVEEVSADELHGVGLPDLPFEDRRGDGVTALLAEAPTGRLERLGLSGLVADAGRVVPVRANAEIAVVDVSHQRALAGVDLPAMLSAAQNALAEAQPGTWEVWQLPAGEFTLAAGLTLGVAGRSLTLRGDHRVGQRTLLRFFADAADAPIAGDLTCLALSGDTVAVEALAISASATGVLAGIGIAATSARLTELRCDGLAGAAVTGISVIATDSADLSDIAVTDAHAVGAGLVGVRLAAARATSVNLRIADGTAVTEAIGADIVAGRQAAASIVSARRLRGARAVGLRLRVPGADAELSLLDVTVTDIETATGEEEAIGVALASARDADIRGLTVSEVTGARATGVLAGIGRGFDWLVGEVRNIRSLDAGAAGVRLVALPSLPLSAAAPSIALRDLQVEAISGAVPGSEAAPPLSWAEAVDSRFADLVEDAGLARLPTTADPDHHEDIAGLVVLAPVTVFESWVDHADPGSVIVENCLIRRVSGSAVQITAALRDVAIRGCEIWTALRGGWIDAERILVANLTAHRLQAGFVFGPGEFSVFNTLLTGVAAGPGLVLGTESGLGDIGAAFVANLDVPFRPPPNPLPHMASGPEGPLPAEVQAGGLAPADPVDLRLVLGSPLHQEARRITGDPVDVPIFVGAYPPETDSRCILRDPLAPAPDPAPAQPDPGPFVDYRARDAQALLALMQDRAKMAMPGWTERSAADMTLMLMELLAYRLDQLAYKQETAVAEGFIGSAHRRRSVEDHARLVDYIPDAGLSATAMLRFAFSDEGKTQLGLRERFDRGETFVIPRDTLAVNPDFNDVSVIFATEADLAYDEQLELLRLFPGNDVRRGAVSAILAGDLVDRLPPGRWLVLLHEDPAVPGHVVRVVRVELSTDGTRVVWDPRRPAPAAYPVDATSILGNVVPAHHGVPVTPLDPAAPAAESDASGLSLWRERLRVSLDNVDGTLREIAVPLAPVSVQAMGWPLPDESGRRGNGSLSLVIDGEPWQPIEDLSLAQSADPVFVLRAGVDGGTQVRFGNGDNGLALPRRQIVANFSLRVGLGTQGNVGAGALRQILTFGEGGGIDELIADSDDRRDLLFKSLSVRNDIAAVGGRDPEPIERVRYRAPRMVRNTLSAVLPPDYEQLLQAMPEVAGARASVIRGGIRHLIRVVLLLRDEDQLTLSGLGDEEAQAERLRRWALVRSRLEAIRLLGWDVELLPPIFVPLDLDLIVDAEPWATAEAVRRGVVAALSGDGGLFDPDTTGLGGDVHVDALHRAALQVPGVAALRVQRLRRLQPFAIDFTETGTLPVGDDEVAVLRRPYGIPDGLLTVTVCGGLP